MVFYIRSTRKLFGISQWMCQISTICSKNCQILKTVTVSPNPRIRGTVYLGDRLYCVTHHPARRPQATDKRYQFGGEVGEVLCEPEVVAFRDRLELPREVHPVLTTAVCECFGSLTKTCCHQATNALLALMTNAWGPLPARHSSQRAQEPFVDFVADASDAGKTFSSRNATKLTHSGTAAGHTLRPKPSD